MEEPAMRVESAEQIKRLSTPKKPIPSVVPCNRNLQLFRKEPS